MSNIYKIRRRLGVSQRELGKAIGVRQGSISHYEVGLHEMPPKVARRLVEAAKAVGHTVTFDDIYGAVAEDMEQPA